MWQARHRPAVSLFKTKRLAIGLRFLLDRLSLVLTPANRLWWRHFDMRSPICLFFPFEQFQTMLCFGWKKEKEEKKTREGKEKKINICHSVWRCVRSWVDDIPFHGSPNSGHAGLAPVQVVRTDKTPAETSRRRGGGGGRAVKKKRKWWCSIDLAYYKLQDKCN